MHRNTYWHQGLQKGGTVHCETGESCDSLNFNLLEVFASRLKYFTCDSCLVLCCADVAAGNGTLARPLQVIVNPSHPQLVVFSVSCISTELNVSSSLPVWTLNGAANFDQPRTTTVTVLTPLIGGNDTVLQCRPSASSSAVSNNISVALGGMLCDCC